MSRCWLQPLPLPAAPLPHRDRSQRALSAAHAPLLSALPPAPPLVPARFSAACRSSSRNTEDPIPSFCAASAANCSRASVSGMRRICRQQKVHRLHLLLRARPGKLHSRPLNQIVGLPPRPAQRFLISVHAPLANKPVRIESTFERHNLHVNPSSVSSAIDFSAALAPAVSGSKFTITFEVCRRKIAHLLLGECRSARRDHVLDSGQKHADAVHLAPPPAAQTPAREWPVSPCPG